MDPILPAGVASNPQFEIRNPTSSQEARRLRETAQEFEGVFLGLLLKAMRSSVGSGGLFKEGDDARMYQEMFDQEVGRSLSRSGGIGLAEMILRDQERRQETSQVPRSESRYGD